MAAEKAIVQRSHIVCLDFETGGLKATKNPITQVAVQSFRIDTLEEISRYTDYCQKYDDKLIYEQGALDYTHITMHDIDNGVPVKQLVKNLCEEFEKANIANNFRKKPILLGHNIAFDISFLRQIFNHCKVDLGKYLHCQDDEQGNSYPIFFDTMLMSQLKWADDPTMTSFKLEVCCEKAGIALYDAHDAQNDVSATKALFIYLTNHLRTGAGVSEQSEQARFRSTFQF
jgi:DNA polymerase III alpha subunit (gram-positive type)